MSQTREVAMEVVGSGHIQEADLTEFPDGLHVGREMTGVRM